MNNPAQHKSVSRILLWIALAVGAAALVGEAGYALGSHYAAAARASLEADRPDLALKNAARAIAFQPYQVEVHYSRLVALKRLGRWNELAEAARRDARWHPDTALVLTLEAEAEWKTGQSARACEAIWEALWRTPTPRRSPAQSWRLAMLAGRAQWGPADRRVAAAAVRLLGLLDHDPTMPPDQRAAARAEAAEVLRQSGAPLTAKAIQNHESHE